MGFAAVSSVEELLFLHAQSAGDTSPLSGGEQFRDVVDVHLLQLVECVTAVGERFALAADAVF